MVKNIARVFIALLIAALAAHLAITIAITQNLPEPFASEGNYHIYLPVVLTPSEVNWSMVAANPQRTSWTSEEVSGDLQVEWYRPIEAYISQNVQVVASNGNLYIATARGLYTLNAATGDIVWRFNTLLPLGNSPTVYGGVVYVGGYDRKLHALDAVTGHHLWSFEGADAGFSTNPLVVDGLVLAGNRDGYFYAIGAHGTPMQGQQLWKFKTNGLIDLSAAYKDGVVYFASNDNYAYALQAGSGDLVWKSDKLPGDGFQSYWPVIYDDKVIFPVAYGYRDELNPGTASLSDPLGSAYTSLFNMERDDLFPSDPDNTIVGPVVHDQDWAHGNPVIDVTRITEYLEDNPNPASHAHKPWRRSFVALNLNNGEEHTFDSDGDGHQEYIPVAFWGTHSGNRYPPLIGPDEIIYLSNIYKNGYIPQGKVMGWKPDTQYMSVLKGGGAVDEVQAISAGGNMIYRSICCDRVGDYFSIVSPNPTSQLWSYHTSLDQ